MTLEMEVFGGICGFVEYICDNLAILILFEDIQKK